MNNKRQTIWLVSMLSLMVILSAYYLFTDDSGTKAPPVAESTQVDGQKPGAGQEANGTAGDELVVNEVRRRHGRRFRSQRARDWNDGYGRNRHGGSCRGNAR